MASSRSDAKKRPARRGNRSVDPDLLELIRISLAVGGDPDLVQGGGGNTSVKSRDGSLLWIKTSGTPLPDVSVDSGWAAMDLAATRAIVASEGLARLDPSARDAQVRVALAQTVRRPSGAVPSSDAAIHALLGRFVIHTHPVGLGALLAAKDSAKAWAKVLGDLADDALYVPYVDPGFPLALRIAKELERWAKTHEASPRVLLLENHGLFVSAEDPDECLDISQRVVSAGSEWIGGEPVNVSSLFRWARIAEPGPAEAASWNGAQEPGAGGTPAEVELRGAILRSGGEAVVVRRDESRIAAQVVASETALAALRKGPFTPDQYTYCGRVPALLPKARKSWASAIASHREKEDAEPRVYISKEEGVFFAASGLAEVRVIGDVFRGAAAAALHAEQAGGARALSRSQLSPIASPSRAAGAGALTGRVAMITGAGSGLGKGIALGIIAAGATVIGLDVDASALDEVAAECPRGRFLPVRCDVTDETSVALAFRAAVLSTGGIDHLVNAAGIAPSFPLVDFPLGPWKKTLDINLTGYFLMAREAARLLLAQGAGGAMVHLTSKSGLDASKANSAYNATKAGEIHLMRGWALELGPAGIRVNCVAPGNVFKGSKIWNAEYIKVCARKKGIRPEEVIPYYTSLTALGKEIEPSDIANACVFLLSEAARNITGQTLVVDGGQVMVR